MTPELINELFQSFNKVDNRTKELNVELSNIDKELSNFYHKVEMAELKHIAISHKLMKELKDILNRRREIKYQSLVFRMVSDTLSPIINKVKSQHEQQIKSHKKCINEMKQNAINNI